MKIKYNFIIYGSSDITNYHIEALKTFKNVNILGIHTKNKIKGENISKKHNIKFISDLNCNEVNLANSALITSSTSTHLDYIVSLKNICKFLFVEKPIVKSKQDFEILRKVAEENKIFVKEISFFHKIYTPFFCDEINVKVEKCRSLKDFHDFKGEINKYKSPIFNHLPHYYDLAYNFLNGNLELQKYELLDYYKELKMFRKINLKFKNFENKVANISIDTSSKINKTQIYFDNNKKYLKFLFHFINFFINKFNIYSLLNKYKKIKLIKMYNYFFNEIKLNQSNYMNNLKNKVDVLEFLNKETEKLIPNEKK